MMAMWPILLALASRKRASREPPDRGSNLPIPIFGLAPSILRPHAG